MANAGVERFEAKTERDLTMRRALIACGGTGGHLSPGIALAEELLSRGWKCELLISNKQVDSRLVNKYGAFEYASIPGSALSFSPVRFLKFIGNLVSGIRLCARKIRETKPDVVVGFGGFLSAPALLAGKFSKTPVVIHEANRIPGRLTRLASKFVDRLYLPHGVTMKIYRSDRIRSMGMPVRSEIKKILRSQAKQELGFDPDRKLLLVFGGSQGARSLNKWVEDTLDSLAEAEIQVLCLTGLGGEREGETLSPSKKGGSVKSLFLGFSDQMALMLSAADLAVSRSGAGSIAEIERCRTPSILVPYPYAADNHQHFNAQRFESEGGCITVEHYSMSELLDRVMEIINDDSRLRQFEANLEAMDRAVAQVEMAEDLEEIIASRDATRGGKVAVSR